MKKRLLSGVSALALRRLAWVGAIVLLCVPDAPPRAETGGAAVAAAPAAMPGGTAPAEDPDEGPAEGPAEAGEPGFGAQRPPAWVLAHGPYTHWYPDRTQLVKNRATPGDEKVWKDVIGTREFDTKGMAAWWEGKVLHLAIFTNFPDRNVMAAGRPVAPADLALDLDGNGTLETGIVLSGVRRTGDNGVERPAGIRPAAAYRVSKWLRPDDILQHTYGQGWRWTGISGQELAYAAVPVWVGAGTLRDDLAVTVDWRVNGRGSDYVVFVTLAKTAGDGDLRNVPIIWGTGVCGNDVIFAPLAETGDLFENIAAEQEAQEKADAAGEAGEAGAGVPDGAFIDDAVFGSATTDETEGEDSASEIVTEGISEISDENAPTWNETFPVAFGGEDGGGASGTSGGTSGGTTSGGSVEEGGGSAGSLPGGSGGAISGGGGSGGGGGGEGGEGGGEGAISEGGEPEGTGGEESSGAESTAGGGEPENPLAPEGAGGEGGSGEGAGGGEGGGGEGETLAAVEIPEPSVTAFWGAALAGYMMFRARRWRRRKGLPG